MITCMANRSSDAIDLPDERSAGTPFAVISLRIISEFIMPRRIDYPVTPDGRYFVVRGRLWRMTNPALPESDREQLVKALSQARSALRRTATTTTAGRVEARKHVHAAKTSLGERGPVWWVDGAPDYNRHMAANTPYRGWYERLPAISNVE